MQAGLRGRWQACGECEGGRAGLELTADGRWYALYADDTGLLWRAIEWKHSGAWETYDMNAGGWPDYRVRWIVDGAGTASDTPLLYGEPGRRSLVLSGDSNCRRYVELVAE